MANVTQAQRVLEYMDEFGSINFADIGTAVTVIG